MTQDPTKKYITFLSYFENTWVLVYQSQPLCAPTTRMRAETLANQMKLELPQEFWNCKTFKFEKLETK